MTRDAGWGAIKAKLKGLSATDLMALVGDLYQASPENRQFLRGRLVPTAADLEKYRNHDRRGVPRPAEPKSRPDW